MTRREQDITPLPLPWGDRACDCGMDRSQVDQSAPRDRPSATPLPGAELAAWLFMARRLREEVLGADLFSDPAWDILLDVYAATARGEKVQISSLSPMSGVPSSTARRWAHKLIELGILERERDPKDHRLTYIRLSKAGHQRIMTFITRLLAKGPPPPIMR